MIITVPLTHALLHALSEEHGDGVPILDQTDCGKFPRRCSVNSVDDRTEDLLGTTHPLRRQTCHRRVVDHPPLGDGNERSRLGGRVGRNQQDFTGCCPGPDDGHTSHRVSDIDAVPREPLKGILLRHRREAFHNDQHRLDVCRAPPHHAVTGEEFSHTPLVPQ